MVASEGTSRIAIYKWISWPCPIDGEIALNVDGSSLVNPGAVGFGSIFIDHIRPMMHGYF
ncbi:hypothetical protein SESBI_07063 [Sesbania bispinosa]|nr:hypothetical protein SESBI_07063 [Sesbania bispinosa]